MPKREETVDGFERQLATNYLGHFTMTALLLSYMNNEARIIPVAKLAGNDSGIKVIPVHPGVAATDVG